MVKTKFCSNGTTMRLYHDQLKNIIDFGNEWGLNTSKSLHFICMVSMTEYKGYFLIGISGNSLSNQGRTLMTKSESFSIKYPDAFVKKIKIFGRRHKIFNPRNKTKVNVSETIRQLIDNYFYVKSLSKTQKKPF